jgi:hypothetical protein
MNTRTLRNIVIPLVVILVGAIVYLQWSGNTNAAGAGNEGAMAEGTLAFPAAGGAHGTAAPVRATTVGASRAENPAARRSGVNGVTASTPRAKEVRPLTPVEKEKVEAAMTVFRKTIERISPRHRSFILADVDSGLSKALSATIATTEIGRGINAITTTVAPKELGSDSSAQKLTEAVLFSVASASPSNDSEAEQIAAASKGLSEVLQQFEAGSPAWREARRQGEALMARMNQAIPMTISSRFVPAKELPAQLELQTLPSTKPPAGK